MYPHGVLEALNRERRKRKRGDREKGEQGGGRGAKWLGRILTHIVAFHPLKQSL